jgi:hypothetical protein
VSIRCALSGPAPLDSNRARSSARTRRGAQLVRSWLLAGAAFCAISCGGGEYGFARTYAPLGAEGTHFEQAQQPTYQDLIRDPNKYKEVEIGWFGVVTGMSAGPKGRTRIALSLRAHQARHLCSEESSSSCRVTVSEAPLANFTADVSLSSSEINGKERVWTGSLLKVYGTYTGEYSEETGPVIDVVYHRHWPRGTYVTTAARGSMRR